MRSKLRFLAAALGLGAAFFVSVRANDFAARHEAVVATKGWHRERLLITLAKKNVHAFLQKVRTVLANNMS